MVISSHDGLIGRFLWEIKAKARSGTMLMNDQSEPVGNLKKENSALFVMSYLGTNTLVLVQT